MKKIITTLSIFLVLSFIVNIYLFKTTRNYENKIALTNKIAIERQDKINRWGYLVEEQKKIMSEMRVRVFIN